MITIYINRMSSQLIMRAQYLSGPLGLLRAQLWAPEANAYGKHCCTVYFCTVAFLHCGILHYGILHCGFSAQCLHADRWVVCKKSNEYVTWGAIFALWRELEFRFSIRIGGSCGCAQYGPTLDRHQEFARAVLVESVSVT